MPALLEEIDVEEFEERHEHLSMLAKSADYTTREHAEAGLAELNRLAATGLVKAGPKGYIHGWIYVGGGNVGDHVVHPEHGHGTIARRGTRTVTVQFHSGEKHAFEHHDGGGQVGEHFVARAGHRAAPAPKPKSASTDLHHHLDEAHKAIKEGRHADAVNHLMAAHSHSEDPEVRRKIKAMQHDLAGHLMHGGPGPAEAPKPAKANDARSVEERIVAAHRDLYRGQPSDYSQWVGLADLREHRELAGVPREKVDAGLRSMEAAGSHDGSVRVIPVANTKALSQRDREAALVIGGEENHALHISPGYRPTSAGPTAEQDARRPGPKTPKKVTDPEEAKRVARDLVNAESYDHAHAAAQGLRGERLHAVGAALGVHLHGSADDKRHQVAQSAIGAAETSAAIRFHGKPEDREAFLADYRARRTRELGGEAEGTRQKPAAERTAHPLGGNDVRTAAAGPRRSDKPLVPNTWGSSSSEVTFHPDGEIGQAIDRMGADRHLEVEGDALANHLGRAATDTVMGRTTAEQQLGRLRQLRDQTPAGSAARRSMDRAIRNLEAPDSPAPSVPDGTLAPLRQLTADLHAVPLARRDPSRELEPLQQIQTNFAQGKIGGSRLLHEVRNLGNRRHESMEGKFQIDRAVQQAASALEAMQKKDRKSLFPPTAV